MKPPARLLLWAGLGLAVVVVATALLGGWLLLQLPHGDFAISINGRPLHWPDTPGWVGALGVGGGLLALLFGVLLMPLLVVLMLLLCGFGLLLGLGASLLVLALVLLVSLSPLWLAVLLLWWALRRKPRPDGSMPK
jgi:hypothetical protein